MRNETEVDSGKDAWWQSPGALMLVVHLSQTLLAPSAYKLGDMGR